MEGALRMAAKRATGFVMMVALTLVLAPASAFARGVTVEKVPVVVVRKTFGRRNPAKDMPPQGRRADAGTRFRFGWSANARYAVTSQQRDAPRRRGGNGGNAGGDCAATARINDLDVRIELEITIWVP